MNRYLKLVLYGLGLFTGYFVSFLLIRVFCTMAAPMLKISARELYDICFIIYMLVMVVGVLAWNPRR